MAPTEGHHYTRYDVLMEMMRKLPEPISDAQVASICAALDVESATFTPDLDTATNATAQSITTPIARHTSEPDKTNPTARIAGDKATQTATKVIATPRPNAKQSALVSDIASDATVQSVTNSTTALASKPASSVPVLGSSGKKPTASEVQRDYFWMVKLGFYCLFGLANLPCPRGQNCGSSQVCRECVGGKRCAKYHQRDHTISPMCPVAMARKECTLQDRELLHSQMVVEDIRRDFISHK